MDNFLFEGVSHEDLKKNLFDFYCYAKKELNIERHPKLFLNKDPKNADNFFGKTGHYEPETEEIHLYITDRHAKDIVRSFAHELIHHHQNLIGLNVGLNLSKTKEPDYASKDVKLRDMERDAFERGNMLFRDWCDMKKMEIKNMLNEKTGKMPMKVDKQDADQDGNTTEKVPAYLDKGDAKKKKSTGPVPPQLAKYVGTKKNKNIKKAKKQASEDIKHRSGKDVLESDLEEQSNFDTTEKLSENTLHPYPQLFVEKKRLFDERNTKKEELVYQELMRRFIKK